MQTMDKRFIAFWLDILCADACLVLPMLLLQMLGKASVQELFPPSMLLGVVLLLLRDISGRSVGKRVMRLRLVSATDAAQNVPVSKRIGHNLTTLIWPVEFLCVMLGPEHTRLGDQWLNLAVIEEPEKG